MPSTFNHAIRQMLGDREHQEDTADRFESVDRKSKSHWLLQVVADGMGGHLAGEKASNVATERFIQHFKSKRGLPTTERLGGALTAANEAVAEEMLKDPESCAGMGTTLLAFLTNGSDLAWVSVGDSPLLLYRDASLQMLNADHSMAPIIEEFIEAGALPAEARHTHPHRNLLRSAISGGEIAEIDLREQEAFLRSGDVVLGCSDGLMSLPEERICETIGANAGQDAETIAEALIGEVEAFGAVYQDNCTVAVVVVNAD